MKRMKNTLLICLTLMLMTSFLPSSVTVHAQASGSFNILTYNIGGLPWFLSSSDPATNTPIIGQRLYPFDIVNVQEDFNYHAALYANDQHPYRTPTSGGAGIGSGLNTLSNFPISNLRRVTWNQRYGLFDSGSDQLTPKGFTLLQAKLAEGVYIDIYNLHADAGTDPNSMIARADNMRQLKQYILDHSEGNAVIVFGDTNTRYTREQPLLDEFLSETGLTDVWVEQFHNGVSPSLGDALIDHDNLTSASNEIVDKVFYRSNALINLEASQYQLEDTHFLDSNNNQLSDHYAISTVFDYTLSSTIAMSDPFGGSGGTPFNLLDTAIDRNISSFTLQSGARVDGFTLVYSDATSSTVGGTANATTLTLDPDEYITSVTLNKAQRNGDDRIFYMNVVTSKNKQISGGSTTSSTITYTAPAGWYIAGFYGRAANELDAIGVIYKKI